MAAMDASQSALDSLRTVEFRETLKGYHRDDVDEYLEKAAVEAEGTAGAAAPEHRATAQGGRDHRPARDRVGGQARGAARGGRPRPSRPSPTTPSSARWSWPRSSWTRPRPTPRPRPPGVIADAEAQARKVQAESEQRLREEIARLESNRSHLSHEVETMARQLETERDRLRSALSEMLSWVDGNLNAPRRRGVAGHQHLRCPARHGRGHPSAPLGLASPLSCPRPAAPAPRPRRSLHRS